VNNRLHIFPHSEVQITGLIHFRT